MSDKQGNTKIELTPSQIDSRLLGPEDFKVLNTVIRFHSRSTVNAAILTKMPIISNPKSPQIAE